MIKPTATDDLITNELIELHAEAICNATGGPQWDELQNTRQAGIMRAEARAALAVVAPLIAARAWDEGFAMSELAWRHIYDGHDCAEGEMCPTCCQPNPYRADQIGADA